MIKDRASDVTEDVDAKECSKYAVIRYDPWAFNSTRDRSGSGSRVANLRTKRIAIGIAQSHF
jgi:hypothetical protein